MEGCYRKGLMLHLPQKNKKIDNHMEHEHSSQARRNNIKAFILFFPTKLLAWLYKRQQWERKENKNVKRKTKKPLRISLI